MPVFDSTLGREAGSKPKLYAKKTYRDAIAIQRVLIADIQSGETRASERSQAARAWVDIEQVKRAMLGIGNPKPVAAVNDPTLQPAKRKARSQDAASPDAPTPGA